MRHRCRILARACRAAAARSSQCRCCSMSWAFQDPHLAIGTSALAVAASAFANLLGHWRAGTVKWGCAAIFAGAGIFGAAGGSTVGKLIDGDQLLFLFALIMFAAGAAMLRGRAAAGDPHVHINATIAAQADRARPRCGICLRLFRHRRRVPDRSRGSCSAPACRS